MRAIDLITATLEQNLGMLKYILSDFTDEDLLVRPLPNANSTLWQLRHLIVVETHMGNAARPGSMPALPAGFGEESKAPGTKAETLALFDRTRAATVQWVQSLTDADLDAPAPEDMREFIPTIGALALFHATHLTMHLGQMQVIRRKLGKPVLT